MQNAKWRLVTAGIAATTLAALSACSAGSAASSGTTEAGATAASSPTALTGEWTGGDVTVKLWHDNPAIKPAVDLFNAEHAAEGIQIAFTETTDMNQAVHNAAAAGNAPDLFPTDSQALPQFAAEGIAANVTEEITPVKDEYRDIAISSLQIGDSIYGVPSRTIPGFMLYNAPAFQKAGLQYPTTWEEFIEDGKKLRQDGVYIYNLAGEDPSTFVYLAWQAGARWWTLDGDGWRIDVDNEATAKAADVVQQLLDNDMVTKISYAEYAAMMQQYNDGKIASRQLSTWQTKNMQANLSTGLGQWEPFANPEFAGMGPANTQFSGAYAINDKSSNKEAAIFAAHWLSTDDGAVKALASPADGLGWFPAVTDPSPYIPVSEPTALLGEHTDQWEPVVQNAVDTQLGDWTYGPNALASFTYLQDLWGKTVAGQMKASEIAPLYQAWIVNDLKQSGVNVIEG